MPAHQLILFFCVHFYYLHFSIFNFFSADDVVYVTPCYFICSWLLSLLPCIGCRVV
ncbi:hypothetical protein BJ912DRAFT_974723, partial [Pholiota molesta]